VSDPVTFAIDGREVQADEGSFVLSAAREAGIEIPTLCDDPALEPIGACRLCMVEVGHPDWNGWSGLMTACLYPVAPGIQVSTTSPRVLAARRHVLTLQAARCPSSETIRALAEQHGVNTEGLSVDPEADNCILCGLCTRLCETYVTSAITTYGRGSAKAIGTFAGAPPAECVGCGSCALICPTDNIPAQRTSTGYEIWGRTFDTAVCAVERTRCTGCGSCEEACPFAVARVVLSADGRRVARIPREHCRGCGACVGACPSGAIDQEGYERERVASELSAAPVTVLACPRADLARQELPAQVGLVEVPCSGRATQSLLLGALTTGAEGVLVLGRHEESCRLNGAEDPARAAVERARLALAMVGDSPERLRFELPEAGPEGPLHAVSHFAAQIAGLGTRTFEEAPSEGEGLDADLALLSRISMQPELRPDGSAWLAEHDLPGAAPGGALLYPGVAPYLDVLAAPLLAPLSVPEILRSALALLAELGCGEVGLRIGGSRPPAAHHAPLFAGASAVYTLCATATEHLKALGVEALSLEQLLLERAAEPTAGATALRVAWNGSDEGRRLIEALGHNPVDLGEDPMPPSFTLSPVERRDAEEYLQRADTAGANAFLVTNPMNLARWGMITREGGWRSSRVLPVLAHQLVHLARHARPAVTQLQGSAR